MTNNITEYQGRLDCLNAQQRLMERHLEKITPLSPEDIADLEIIIKYSLSKNGYTLNELEKLRIDHGRIYGRANVTSSGTSDGDLTRHHTAIIDFHTDYAYSVVFDNHKVGGDEWVKQTNNIIYQLSYSAGKQRLYMNGVEIYRTKAGNADLVLRTIFELSGPVKQFSDFTDSYGHTRKDSAYSINTKQIISNIKNISKLPDSLDFIFSSFDDGKGIKIITEITEKDVKESNINTELIDNWLASK